MPAGGRFASAKVRAERVSVETTRVFLLSVCLVVGLLRGLVRAEDVVLSSLEQVHAACRAADEFSDHERLYSVLVDGPVPLQRHVDDEDGTVVFRLVYTRTPTAFGGRVQLVPARLESMGFPANEDRERTLEQALALGARLRIGFFLGFDDPRRRSCLVRPPQGVTTVRIEFAFVELVDAAGSVVAREDHERLRAWREGSLRARASEPSARILPLDGSAELWARVLESGQPERQLRACHDASLARSGRRAVLQQVRLEVRARTGDVAEAVVEAGNAGDDDLNACVLSVFRGLTFGPIGGSFRTVILRVRVELVAP